MKYFIDGGANDSCSARLFRKLYDPNSEYYIYSFEIESMFFNDFNDMSNLTFIKKAIWIEDGTILFYKDLDPRAVGGSLIKEKRGINKKVPISVECIDFCKWFKEIFSVSDEIILKLDIEGAEYRVLEKMLDDGLFNDYNIIKLFIEWHAPKINLPMEKHNFLVSRIKIPIERWDAFGDSKKMLRDDSVYSEILKRYR